MTADHLSYKRATSVSLLGLAIQFVVTLGLLLYAIYGKDPAAMSAAFAAACGIPIWIALAIVFHQHRLERVEAMEAEAYAASTAAQASVFAEAATDQTGQRNRLAWMHKWFLPVMSLLNAGALIGLGLFLFFQNRSYPDLSPFEAPPQPGWAIAIGVVIAALCFIFARFVAGMAKQPVWQLLHAGSAASVGAALLGLALVIAHFLLAALDQNSAMRYMPLIIDVAMIAIGAEMFLNFILNLYRPRRPGEYLRPGFDSRVLAFVAAPDRLAESISDAINYQFGFNVSSTWFYRLLSRSIGGLLLLGLLIIWGMSVVSVVRPDEKGLKLANGRLAAEVGPGLVWKYPWPFGTVETFPASAVNEINIGAGKPKPNEPILWTNAHATEESYFLVQAGSALAGNDAASGMALLAAEVPVHYNVNDLKLYTDLAQDGPSNDPQKLRQDLLRAVASSAIIERMANYSVEQVLGPQRGEISHALAQDIQKAFDKLNDGRGAGVRVMFVGLNGVHPERETAAPAFEKVVQADQARQGKIEAARGQAIKTLATVAGDVERARTIVAELTALDQMRTDKADAKAVTLQEQKVMDLILGAGGEAATIISKASAKRWARHMGERARAVRSEGQLAAYRSAPRAYKMGIYLDAMRDAMRDVRVWVTPFENLRIRTDFSEVQPDISAFEADLEKNQGK